MKNTEQFLSLLLSNVCFLIVALVANALHEGALDDYVIQILQLTTNLM